MGQLFGGQHCKQINYFNLDLFQGDPEALAIFGGPEAQIFIRCFWTTKFLLGVPEALDLLPGVQDELNVLLGVTE